MRIRQPNKILWYSCWVCRGIDFTPFDQSKVPEDAPIIVVQHGLTGGIFI